MVTEFQYNKKCVYYTRNSAWHQNGHDIISYSTHFTLRLPYMQCPLEKWPITLKTGSRFFIQNSSIYIFNVARNKCNISVSKRSNVRNIHSALWILMAWCFRTRPWLYSTLFHSISYLRTLAPETDISGMIGNCIQQNNMGAITYPCQRYLLLAPKFSCLIHVTRLEDTNTL